MQCEICFRTNGKAYLCPMDARNELYGPRIQHAQVLLEKDSLAQEIEDLQQKDLDGTRISLTTLQADAAHSTDRTREIISRADALKANIDAAREELVNMKAANALRKADLQAAKSGTEPRRARQVDDLQKSTKMSTYKWNKDHNTLALSRAFLCGEAAKLYGLRRTVQPDGQDEYLIGNIKIMDLRTLNTVSPATISTALSHVVHLLMLSTHYLSLRLPAEITLPHRDYPLPTIFPLSSSYKHVDNIQFPGTTPVQSSNNSPTTSRHSHLDPTSQPRPRPLFITKPLPLLLKEDPVGYSLFIEAVTLLAHDVAWVCMSQGIPIGDETSFEDICNIGKNMYNLLIGSRSRPAPTSRTSSTTTTPTKGGRESDSESARGGNLQGKIMGHWSHGAAHSSLASAAGQEFVRSWKLMSPTKIADKLKSRLMSEVANAEWEFLKEDAWAVDQNDGELGDEAVVVGARRSAERGYGLGMQSFMSMRSVHNNGDALRSNMEVDRKPGSNGWTKLKPR